MNRVMCLLLAMALTALALGCRTSGDVSVSSSPQEQVRAVPEATRESLPAFPGAEGFGADTPGGRGGRVIKVTNLNASGPGSLQAACEATGPRIVVFDVSGVIRGDVTITEPHITIAGQTAPGGGITIEGRLLTAYRGGDQPRVHDIVIRFLRVRARPGLGNQGDCIQFSTVDRAVIDHVSLSWAEDETIDLYTRATNVTLQWSALEESSATEQRGGGHNYGLISGPNSKWISIHHNLFAHQRARSPCMGSGPADFRNNVIYNFRDGFVHHGNYRDPGFNIVGNYYKSGPSTVEHWPQDPYIYPWCFEDEVPYYLRDNLIEGVGMIQDPWAEADKLPAWKRYYAQYGVRQEAPTWAPPIAEHSPEEAYELVLRKAGCFPRDTVTTRTIDEVRNGTGSWGRHEPPDLMAGLVRGDTPTDSDSDGMSDAWEASRGLEVGKDDSSRKMASGYTAVEEYVNDLAARLIEAGS